MSDFNFKYERENETELQKLRRKAKLKSIEFSKFVGVTDRSVRRWESGEVPTPAYILKLIKYYIKYGDIDKKKSKKVKKKVDKVSA